MQQYAKNVIRSYTPTHSNQLSIEHRYAIDAYEQELPLPSTSTKLLFIERPMRFLTVNRKKRELDYLRTQIQRKCDLHQMHYQAKIQQMRLENEQNKRKLELLLMEQPKSLFDIPNHHSNQIPQRQRLQGVNQSYLRYDTNKPKKIIDSRPVESSSDDSEQQQRERLKKIKEHEQQQNYIYNPKNVQSSTDNFLGESIKKEVDENEQRRREYEWVRRVRKARMEQQISESSFDSDDSVSVETSEPESKKPQKSSKPEKSSQNNHSHPKNHEKHSINQPNPKNSRLANFRPKNSIKPINRSPQ